jgi:16S rRNA pseudouridine516 synthase
MRGPESGPESHTERGDGRERSGPVVALGLERLDTSAQLAWWERVAPGSGAARPVLALLPAPLRQRGAQPVGRLDADTTGALLLTDDGALLHRLTSPRHHVSKVYEVTARHPVSDAQVERLLQGVVLVDSPRPVRAAACERTGTHALRLTLTEGKYHQVKRMLAAVGNRVEALHRSAFGDVRLPADMAPGQWCWIDDPARVPA